jgi:hypothetical protein
MCMYETVDRPFLAVIDASVAIQALSSLAQLQTSMIYVMAHLRGLLQMATVNVAYLPLKHYGKDLRWWPFSRADPKSESATNNW